MNIKDTDKELIETLITIQTLLVLYHDIPTELVKNTSTRETIKTQLLSRLEQSENLKCCGNCKLKHNRIECPEYDYEETNPVVSGGCCDKWQSDQLTRSERTIK